jgi:hypothetical protein
MRLLERQAPRVDVTEVVVAAFPAERPWFGPALEDEVVALLEALSRLWTGFVLDHQVSTPTPRTNPDNTRPPEMRSAMASCSAIRTGLSSIGRILPRSKIFARRVVRPSTAAVMFTPTFTHEGVEWCSLIMRPSKPAWSANSYSVR